MEKIFCFFGALAWLFISCFSASAQEYADEFQVPDFQDQTAWTLVKTSFLSINIALSSGDSVSIAYGVRRSYHNVQDSKRVAVTLAPIWASEEDNIIIAMWGTSVNRVCRVRDSNDKKKWMPPVINGIDRYEIKIKKEGSGFAVVYVIVNILAGHISTQPVLSQQFFNSFLAP